MSTSASMPSEANTKAKAMDPVMVPASVEAEAVVHRWVVPVVAVPHVVVVSEDSNKNVRAALVAALLCSHRALA